MTFGSINGREVLQALYYDTICCMKIYINKVLAIFLFAQGLYFLYSFFLIFKRFINAFDYSAYAIYAYRVYIGTMILFIIAGIGLFRNKNWAILCGWIAILLPQLLKLIEPTARIPLSYNYALLAINILVLIYLSTQWKKLKANQ